MKSPHGRMSFYGVIQKLESQEKDEILPTRVFFAQRKDLEGLPPVSQRRSRRGTIAIEPKIPRLRSQDTGTTIADTPKKKIDKFVYFLQKPNKNFNAGKTVLSKISQNAFFQDLKHLFEEKLDPEGAIYICQKMELETLNPNEVVYKEEERVDGKFYLIYDGEVDVLHSNDTEGGHKEPETKTKPRMSSIFRQIVSEAVAANGTESERRHSTAECRKSVRSDIFSTSHLVKVIKKDDYFGEEALNGKSKRENTMVARTEVHLLSVRITDMEYVKYRFDKERVQRFTFLQENLGITFCTPVQRNNFFDHLNEKTSAFGEVVTNEGDSGTSIYFVCKGKCEVQKRSKDITSTTDCFVPPKNKNNYRKNIYLGGAEAGSFIGEELMFNKASKYDYTVRVASKAIFFEIKLGWFTRIFENEIIAKIQERYLEKTRKYQDIYDNTSLEISKNNTQPYLNPTYGPNGALPSLDINSNSLNMSNPFDKEGIPTLKPKYSLRMASPDPDNSPGTDSFSRRSSFQRFHHQLLSTRLPKKSEDEESLNSPASVQEPKSAARALDGEGTPIDPRTSVFRRTSFFGKDFKEEFNRRSSFNLSSTNEEAASLFAAETPRKLNTQNPEDPSEVFENTRLFLGNVKKKSKFQLVSSRNTARQPEDNGSKKLESARSEDQKQKIQAVRAQFKLFPHLSLQNYLSACKEGNVKKWSWNEEGEKTPKKLVITKRGNITIKKDIVLQQKKLLEQEALKLKAKKKIQVSRNSTSETNKMVEN